MRTNKGKGRGEKEEEGQGHKGRGGGTGALKGRSGMYSAEHAAVSSCTLSFLFATCMKRLSGAVQYLGHVTHQHT